MLIETELTKIGSDQQARLSMLIEDVLQELQSKDETADCQTRLDQTRLTPAEQGRLEMLQASHWPAPIG